MPEENDLSKLPFEDALARLEMIVNEMESGKLPLDEMIKRFESGNSLATLCAKKLEDFEKKIEVLVKNDRSGEEWRNFEPGSEREAQATAPIEPIEDENLSEGTLF